MDRPPKKKKHTIFPKHKFSETFQAETQPPHMEFPEFPSFTRTFKGYNDDPTIFGHQPTSGVEQNLKTFGSF